MPADLKKLEQKIREAKRGKALSAQERRRIKQAHDNKAAMQAGYEFVASAVLAALLGYVIDQWLDTAPIFLISLFLLGTGAGFMAIFRMNNKLGAGVGYSQLHRREKSASKSPATEPAGQAKQGEENIG